MLDVDYRPASWAIREHTLGEEAPRIDFIVASGDKLPADVKDIYKRFLRRNAEISNARADERANTTRTNLFGYAQRGTMRVEDAAQEAGISVDQFRQQMEEYNRSQNSQAQAVQAV